MPSGRRHRGWPSCSRWPRQRGRYGWAQGSVCCRQSLVLIRAKTRVLSARGVVVVEGVAVVVAVERRLCDLDS